MASIIDSFRSLLTRQVTEQIARATDLHPPAVRKGLAVIGPLVAGFAARAATRPGGLHSLLALLPRGFIAATPAGLATAIDVSNDEQACTRLMTGIFDGGLAPVTATLSRALGFDSTALMHIGAPLMLGVVAERIHEEGVDETGAARMLLIEHRAFLSRNDGVARTVHEAMSASDHANALRQKYTPHEWATARLAPLAAAQVVMLASPSGPFGAINELASATQEIKRARGSAVPASLVGLLFDGEISKDEVLTLNDRQVALSIVKEGVAAVKANTPSEARKYGRILVDIAIRTAEGSKEGSFFGIGGTRVTKEEQAAIDAIRSVAD